jgi:hypothetical protein
MATPNSNFKVVDTDEVEPVEIEHRCEELFDGATLREKYNYIACHFEREARYFWARSYTNEIDTVSVSGPFDARSTMNSLPGRFDDAGLCYLRRRFKKIQMLGSSGYAPVSSP